MTALEGLLPAIPASAGALIFDQTGRLLILKPVYKSGWTIPGGVMEADGETPWQACQREVREETGIEVRDAQQVMLDARLIKSPDEIALLSTAAAMVSFHRWIRERRSAGRRVRITGAPDTRAAR